MIQTFRCKDTEKIFNRYFSKKFPADIQRKALLKLRSLDNARDINDLRNPPSNHLEILGGDRKGERSIRINKKWRICFIWKGSHAYNVEIIDYH